jgi:hypothetical protein
VFIGAAFSASFGIEKFSGSVPPLSRFVPDLSRFVPLLSRYPDGPELAQTGRWRNREGQKKGVGQVRRQPGRENTLEQMRFPAWTGQVPNP